VPAPLRLLVYDRTCLGRGLLPGLTRAWQVGRGLYGALGRLDGACGAASWAEALDWLASQEADRRIAEVQFWGHGQWGLARLGDERLDEGSLAPGHAHRPRLERIAERMLPGAAGLWWFRTCETFGTAAGHAFAQAWTGFLGCRGAGHTYVIGVWQSGLHSLLPGETPRWSVDEGLRPAPASYALPSRPGAPNTITCLHGKVPAGY
jgi:hypothetical protein